MATPAVCKIDGCDKRIVARSMCGKHYQRWRKDADEAEVRTHAKAGEPMRWIVETAAYAGDDCVPWPFGMYSTGYGSLNLPTGGSMQASRMMCEVVNGPAPEASMQAAHICGRGHRGCMTPRHLYWADRTENEADKVAHGTSNRGVGNGHAKITPEIVHAIRVSSDGPAALARRYEISAPTICDIRARRSWAWLT